MYGFEDPDPYQNVTVPSTACKYFVYWRSGLKVCNAFCRVLDPNFLKTVSPDLIVAYFNNAKPEDLKAGDSFGFDVFLLA
jgi:hypothetical protein